MEATWIATGLSKIRKGGQGVIESKLANIKVSRLSEIGLNEHTSYILS